jgi:CelD/BcsL family acetyltransferase involved in cellulose biosynthesis
MALRTEWIEDPARFAAVRDEWDRLAALDPSPFSRHAWLSTWWDAFGGDAALRVCLVRDGDEPAAALPLLRRGGALGGLANEHSPSLRPLARDPQARVALAAALAEAKVTIELPALPSEEAEAAELIAALEARGARTLLEPDYVSPIAETAGSFDDYRAELKGGWRELERRGRKMRREHEVAETLVATPADLERELQEGLELEASGWKGRAGTAILAEEHTARFYRAIADAFHDELRLSALRVDGRLVGFDLALLHERRYFLLKTAYAEDLRSLAPGLVLRRAVIERCFELGLEAHEFLGPDMEWKRLFATGDRPHAVCRVYPRGPLPALRLLYRRDVRPRLKRAYRRVRPARPRRRARAGG